MKDLALTNVVPLLKKCLEAFVYRVKAMLTMNKCLEALITKLDADNFSENMEIGH
jgi:hypothetical protein